MKIPTSIEDLQKKCSTASAIKGWSVFFLVLGIVLGVVTIAVGICMAILGKSVFYVEDSLLIIAMFSVSGIIIFLTFWILSLFIRGFGEIIQNTSIMANSSLYQTEKLNDFLDSYDFSNNDNSYAQNPPKVVETNYVPYAAPQQQTPQQMQNMSAPQQPVQPTVVPQQAVPQSAAPQQAVPQPAAPQPAAPQQAAPQPVNPQQTIFSSSAMNEQPSIPTQNQNAGFNSQQTYTYQQYNPYKQNTADPQSVPTNTTNPSNPFNMQ